jgi:hypothetical protein
MSGGGAVITAHAAGASDPQALHKEMLQRIASLEEAMAKLVAPEPGIGHNHPPEFPFGNAEREAVATAIAIVKALPPEPTAAPVQAVEAASWLTKIGDRLLAYLGNLCSEASKSAGSELGKRLVQSPFWWPLTGALVATGHAISNWISSLPH